jgi:hypothetical protein
VEAVGFGIQWFLFVLVDVFHVKSQEDKIVTSDTPLNLEVWGPAANAGVTGIGEDGVGGFSRNEEANVATPEGAVLRFQEQIGHDS